ncbi:MAG: DUF4981 domain-containing protein, partial [Propionibacteriaceae bacterium]|nr:DUF4981 domain-containing protein [Propionibacteriaceae bacterium]
PWDGHESIEPGQIPTRRNPVGSYLTSFTLDKPLASGERMTVRFEGVESALAVWLNGIYIGFGADSFTPSEFDLTDALVEGVNSLAVQVYTWTSGSWLEDQDMYRFSGIFRSVTLHRQPVVHAQDVALTCDIAHDCGSADIDLRVELTRPGLVHARVAGVGAMPSVSASGETPTAAGTIDHRFQLHLDQPHLWSSEDPYLYDIVVEVFDETGGLIEHIPLKYGLRRFGIEDGVLKINGQRLIFRGVNRHDFGLNGRVMTRAEAEADMAAMKAANINALRTCHYPDNGFVYDLCDQYGIYVIDEMNLETHGMWDLFKQGRISIDQLLPGDRPEWLPALLDRAANLFQRDKNHTSVIMWSCGNESLGGKDIFEVSQYFRQQDPRRPVHYEGTHHDPRYPDTTDVASDMYTPAEEVEVFLASHRDKPYFLVEYAHAMGNSFGAVDRYFDLAQREPLFQGGFIWDFADQAIQLTAPDGRPSFGYGGDCGEAPHDAEFCGNGIYFADHRPSPKVQEVRHVYQCLATTISATQVSISNHYLFTNSSAFECVAVLARDGVAIAQEVIDTDVAPGQTATYPLPFTMTGPGEHTIEVSHRLRADTQWAPAGHEVAFDQAVVRAESRTRGASELVASAQPPEVIDGIHNIGLRGPHFEALFSRTHGGLVSYRYAAQTGGDAQTGPLTEDDELLQAIPTPSFWHAPTSNERGWNMPNRDGGWYLASRYPSFTEGPDSPRMTLGPNWVELAYQTALPTVPASSACLTYRVFSSGRIEVALRLTPGDNLPDPPELAMMFTVSPDLHRLRWYGEGPEECYLDRRSGARLGLWGGEVVDQMTPYLRPQEAGSHTGVRWATVLDDDGRGLRFDWLGDETSLAHLPRTGGMEFSALPWTPYEVENAAHLTDLPPIRHTIIRPALARRGVGGDNSWGAMTLPQYRLPTTEMTFRFAFEGVDPHC